jgi:hypothetical protein
MVITPFLIMWGTPSVDKTERVLVVGVKPTKISMVRLDLTQAAIITIMIIAEVPLVPRLY